MTTKSTRAGKNEARLTEKPMRDPGSSHNPGDSGALGGGGEFPGTDAGRTTTATGILSATFAPSPLTLYAAEFIEKCEGQQ